MDTQADAIRKPMVASLQARGSGRQVKFVQAAKATVRSADLDLDITEVRASVGRDNTSDPETAKRSIKACTIWVLRALLMY